MDIHRIIDELAGERNRLDCIIESLELMAVGVQPPLPPTGKRRGRKFMDDAGRREVSGRMKVYWAKRRAEEQSERAISVGA